jgi:dipeptidyl aminopeptidase/acylaminoacyl peptidase
MKQLLGLAYGCIVLMALNSNGLTVDSNSPRAMELDDLFALQRVAEPTVSPDGRWIAYQQTSIDVDKNESKSSIYLAAADGSQTPRALTNSGKKDTRPRFSPDSRHLVFQSNRSGSTQLWIIDLQGGEARPLTSIATEASQAVWSTDGMKIAFVSAVMPEHSNLPFADADKANREAEEAKSKSKTSARTFTRLFYRHWDAYVEGKRQHLFVLKLKVGPQGLETDGEPHNATPGDRDAVPTSSTFSSGEDFAFTPDSKHLVFTATPATNEAWNTNFDLCRVPIDNRNDKWETLTSNAAADSGPRFSPDGKSLAWRAQSRPGFEADRWQLTISKVSPDGKLLEAPSSLTPNTEDSVGEFVWLDDSRLAYASDHRGAQRLTIVDRQVKPTGQPALLQPLTERGLYSGLCSAQGLLVASRSTMNFPAEVFAYRDLSNSTNISQANTARLKQLELPRPESITSIDVEGEQPMQMWILKPPGFDPTKKYPVVYLVHGGPQGAWEDGWSFRWCPQMWAAQGYVIAMPNPRGSSGFGMKFMEEISGDWGGKCYRDLMAGADYVESLPYVDRTRIAAAGASFGGYMMNWFAVNTGRFRCLITHCSVWNFESMWGTTDELWFDEYEHGGLPWEKPNKYREFSPHVKAGSLNEFKTPMLVIHNDLDFRCPIGQGHELFASLQRQGVPSRFVNFSNEGHWVSQPANSQLWHQEVFAWLAKYNPVSQSNSPSR